MARRGKKKHSDEDHEVVYDYDDSGEGRNEAGRWQYSRESKEDIQERVERQIASKKKAGLRFEPAIASGRKISKTFWGEAWCRNLEKFHDYESRLPRGRTYLRQGNVVDLKISPGHVAALVAGKELYEVEINFETLDKPLWEEITQSCVGKIDSALDLLTGQIPSSVLSVISDDECGLFPKANEFSMSCNCPDWADMCKHLAATLYGIGARLDKQPELFFVLRGVDHLELVGKSSDGLSEKLDIASTSFDYDELAELFGVEWAP